MILPTLQVGEQDHPIVVLEEGSPSPQYQQPGSVFDQAVMIVDMCMCPIQNRLGILRDVVKGKHMKSDRGKLYRLMVCEGCHNSGSQ